MSNFDMIVVAILVAAILGGIKWATGHLQKQIPNWMWPLATIILAWVGTNTCTHFELPCEGNPLQWDPATVEITATALAAITARELGKWLKPRLATWGFNVNQEIKDAKKD
jgi:hypothetical protein